MKSKGKKGQNDTALQQKNQPDENCQRTSDFYKHIDYLQSTRNLYLIISMKAYPKNEGIILTTHKSTLIHLKILMTYTTIN